MPVGIGIERGEGCPGSTAPCRFVAPRGLHPGALWLAVAAPLLATLCLLARLSA